MRMSDRGRTVVRAVVHDEHVHGRELRSELVENRREVLLLVPSRNEDERVALLGHASRVAAAGLRVRFRRGASRPAFARQARELPNEAVEIEIRGRDGAERNRDRVDDRGDEADEVEFGVREEQQSHTDEWTTDECEPSGEKDDRSHVPPAAADDAGSFGAAPGASSSRTSACARRRPAKDEPDHERDPDHGGEQRDDDHNDQGKRGRGPSSDVKITWSGAEHGTARPGSLTRARRERGPARVCHRRIRGVTLPGQR